MMLDDETLEPQEEDDPFNRKDVVLGPDGRVAGTAPPAEPVAMPEVNDDNRGNVIVPGMDGQHGSAGRNGRQGKHSPLSEDDPYWQFGTPIEYWGTSRGGAPREAGTADVSGLAPDDPYWQFGTPPSSWGQKKKGGREDGPQAQGRSRGNRPYLECRACGVKIEKKRQHMDRRVQCPLCGKNMREYRPGT